jgi:hypothetical protein
MMQFSDKAQPWTRRAPGRARHLLSTRVLRVGMVMRSRGREGESRTTRSKLPRPGSMVTPWQSTAMPVKRGRRGLAPSAFAERRVEDTMARAWRNAWSFCSDCRRVRSGGYRASVFLSSAPGSCHSEPT